MRSYQIIFDWPLAIGSFEVVGSFEIVEKKASILKRVELNAFFVGATSGVPIIDLFINSNVFPFYLTPDKFQSIQAGTDLKIFETNLCFSADSPRSVDVNMLIGPGHPISFQVYNVDRPAGDQITGYVVLSFE